MTLPAVSALLEVAKEPDRRHGTREAIGLWRSLPEYPAQALESSTPLWSQSVPRFLCHTSSTDLTFVGYKAGPGYHSESMSFQIPAHGPKLLHLRSAQRFAGLR